MRVLFLRREPCARARVQAAALRSARPDIEIGLARAGGPGGEQVGPQWRLGDRPARALRETLAAFSPDVIHSHGPDSFLTVCANELTAGRIPVIHDLGSLRAASGESELDVRALEESAALIAPSAEALEELGSRHMLPPLTCVFPSYLLARELWAAEDHLSAEAHIDRIASLYELLVREPMAGIARAG